MLTLSCTKVGKYHQQIPFEWFPKYLSARDSSQVLEGK